MKDPDALGAMRGCTQTNTAQWLRSGAGPAPSLPPHHQNPSAFHRLPLAPTSFFSLPLFFKMAPAHLESVDEQQDFGLLLGPTTSWMATLEYQRVLDVVVCISEP